MSSRNCFVFFALIAANLGISSPCQAESLTTTKFGEVSIFRPVTSPTSMALYFSGSGRSTSEPLLSPSVLTSKGVLVAVVDTEKYLEKFRADDKDEECSEFSGEIERFAQVLEKNLGMSKPTAPILIGDGVGAAVAYVTLMENQDGFRSAALIDFCPVLPIAHTLCATNTFESEIMPFGVSFAPAGDAEQPWKMFRSAAPGKCPVETTTFLSSQPDKAPTAALVESSLQGFDSLLTAPDDDTLDVPVIELIPEIVSSDSVYIFYSGDGGWAAIDKELGEYFRTEGIPVIGIDSLKYFWQHKPLKVAANELNDVIAHYRERWPDKKVVLLGFSFGADVLPFIYNRLGEEMQALVTGVVLMSPSLKADFEIHLTDWLSLDAFGQGKALAPEAEKVTSGKLLCLYGQDDKDDSVCPLLKNKSQSKSLPGSHHFNQDYQALAKIIQEAVGHRHSTQP